MSSFYDPQRTPGVPPSRPVETGRQPPYYDRRQHQPSLLPYLSLLIIMLVVVGVVLTWRFWPGTNRSGTDPSAQPRPVVARGELAPEELANIQLYERVSPSVVHVTNLASTGGVRLNAQEVPQGTGSGFIWDEEGHVVTNYHVVAGADAARVTLNDHTTYEVQNVWTYPDKDIAVLAINAPRSKLHPILIGSSHDLKVGQFTYAIGNPFGLDQTFTMGVVSALGREIESATNRPIRGVIQTSAAINPGNSGGPLLDSAGRLIGMNTAILSPSGTFAGIGFAIPVDEINRVVPQLIRHGKVVRPVLGVQVAEDQLAQKLGVSDGALIIKVMPDSPAQTAGLRGTRRMPSGDIELGDVIVAINGQPVHNSKDLFTVLDPFKADETVTVTILRDNERQDVKVTLKVMQ